MNPKILLAIGTILCIIGFFGSIFAFIIGGFYFEAYDPYNPSLYEQVAVFISDILPYVSLTLFFGCLLLIPVGVIIMLAGLVIFIKNKR